MDKQVELEVMSGGMAWGAPIPESPDPLVALRWDSLSANDELILYRAKPVEIEGDSSEFPRLETLLTDRPDVCMGGNGWIRIGFGVNHPAWVEFESPDLADPALVEICISEHGEYPQKKGTPVRRGNAYRYEPNAELYEGVRYAWLRSNGSQSWHLTGIRLIGQAKPVNYEGAFACDDRKLTRIWYTGAYTVRACFLPAEMGSILVERGDRTSFTGDAHVSQAVCLSAFGHYDYVKMNLEATRELSNGIRSYPLYWVWSVAEYYRFTGDREAAQAWIPNACRIAQEAMATYETDFEQIWFGWDQRLGAGFEYPNSPGAKAGYRMLTLCVCTVLAEMLEQAGREREAVPFLSFVQDKARELRRNADWPLAMGAYASALAVIAGFPSDDERRLIFETYFQDRVNRSFQSPFHQYFILQALAALGKYEEALASLRDCWGGQLEDGATTFYELYRPSYNAVLPHTSILDCSLCHPWSGGVTRWLSEELLGIRPLAPGFVQFEIRPRFIGGLKQLSGTMPTPRGPIAFAFDIGTGKGNCRIPAGLTGTIALPKRVGATRCISADGAVTFAYAEEAEYVYLTSLPSGDYRLESEALPLDDGMNLSNQPDVTYRAYIIGTDDITQGNWASLYGKDGYVLFPGREAISWKGELPDYITSFNVDKPSRILVDPVQTVNDPRTLPMNRGEDGVRLASAIRLISQDDHSFWINIGARKGVPFRIALYVVDWRNEGLRNVIEMYDGDTLELAAPPVAVKDFGNGRYLSYAYDRSCAFRFFRGSVSGIFFDS